MQFFYIQNRKIGASKKILYQYFLGFFCPDCDSFSPESILCHYIALKVERKYKPLLTF